MRSTLTRTLGSDSETQLCQGLGCSFAALGTRRHFGTTEYVICLVTPQCCVVGGDSGLWIGVFVLVGLRAR